MSLLFDRQSHRRRVLSNPPISIGTLSWSGGRVGEHKTLLVLCRTVLSLFNVKFGSNVSIYVRSSVPVVPSR